MADLGVLIDEISNAHRKPASKVKEAIAVVTPPSCGDQERHSACCNWRTTRCLSFERVIQKLIASAVHRTFFCNNTVERFSGRFHGNLEKSPRCEGVAPCSNQITS